MSYLLPEHRAGTHHCIIFHLNSRVSKYCTYSNNNNNKKKKKSKIDKVQQQKQGELWERLYCREMENEQLKQKHSAELTALQHKFDASKVNLDSTKTKAKLMDQSINQVEQYH